MCVSTFLDSSHSHFTAAMAGPSTSSSSPPSLFPSGPKRVPDDTVFYAIYPDPDNPTFAFSSDAVAGLRALHLRLLSLLTPLFADYIWKHEPFSLSVPSPLASPCPLCGSQPVPHLHGKLRYGDSLEDEWLAASLVFAATSAVPSLSARLWDSDGEFLLVEAAFSLPRWLEPETATNRVFIRHGDIHIIPKKVLPDAPSLDAALMAVRSDAVETRASEKVQAAILKKISGYPAKAMTYMHRARVRVPLPVAQVLKEEPFLIGRAVEAFYDRDLDSMKHAAKLEKFLRTNDGNIEMVRISVRMSRAMYGQLVQQTFQAPKCYTMPLRDEGPAAYMEAELGMKIACGFEMMYQVSRRAGEEGKGSTWEVFKQTLESTGSFDGLLPGSKEYQRILDAAFKYYKCTSLHTRSREIMNAPVQRIEEILSMPFSAENFKGNNLPPNDDDSWMYNGEDELNTAISERQKEFELYETERAQRKSMRQKGTVSNDFSLGDVAENMQAFIHKISTIDGAEVPGNRNSRSIELDADQFMKAMESVLGDSSHEENVSRDEIEGHSSSSDMDFDDSEGSDFDDEFGNTDADDAFMQSYSDALGKELHATTVGKSFVRTEQQSSNVNEGPSSVVGGNDMDEEELTPVDVDVNLVKSFLDSFSSQQGLPGPASNLLGLMGFKVPHDDKKI